MISKLPAGLDPGQRGHGPSMFSFVLETEPGKEFVAMKAREIMTTPAVSIGPLAKVHEVARLLVDSDISAVPVVDIQMRVLGMVSEGDLVRRKELRTQKRRSCGSNGSRAAIRSRAITRKAIRATFAT